jgi:hypothetical protein
MEKTNLNANLKPVYTNYFLKKITGFADECDRFITGMGTPVEKIVNVALKALGYLLYAMGAAILISGMCQAITVLVLQQSFEAVLLADLIYKKIVVGSLACTFGISFIHKQDLNTVVGNILYANWPSSPLQP